MLTSIMAVCFTSPPRVHQASLFFLAPGFNNLPYRRIGEWYDNYKKFGLNYFLPELEPYCSKEIKVQEIKEDTFKLKLLKVVLNRLREIENEESR